MNDFIQNLHDVLRIPYGFSNPMYSLYGKWQHPARYTAMERTCQQKSAILMRIVFTCLQGRAFIITPPPALASAETHEITLFYLNLSNNKKKMFFFL